jgi:hypothetical protein
LTSSGAFRASFLPLLLALQVISLTEERCMVCAATRSVSREQSSIHACPDMPDETVGAKSEIHPCVTTPNLTLRCGDSRYLGQLAGFTRSEPGLGDNAATIADHGLPAKAAISKFIVWRPPVEFLVDADCWDVQVAYVGLHRWGKVPKCVSAPQENGYSRKSQECFDRWYFRRTEEIAVLSVNDLNSYALPISLKSGDYVLEVVANYTTTDKAGGYVRYAFPIRLRTSGNPR